MLLVLTISYCGYRNMAQVVRNSFETIRHKLKKYTGGRILLNKNEDTGIAQIILDRPEKRNALSGQMMIELRDCVENLERWDRGKGVILFGRGPAFCAGGDLDFAKVSGAQDGLDMAIWMQDALVRLQKLPLVSCCLVHGAVLGGGCEVSTFCDYIIAAQDVKYGFVQGKMGITTAWGAGSRLAQKIGPRKALDLLLTSRILGAQECVDFGVADDIVPSEDALEKTVEWLCDKLSHEREVTRAFKTIISNAQSSSYEQSLFRESEIFAPFWGGESQKKTIENKVKHLQQLNE